MPLRSSWTSYGIEANSIAFMTRGTFAEVYRIRSSEGNWVARVRSPEARPEDVRFAASWGQTVAAEVPISVPIAPLETVPRIGHRVVDVAPYIEHHAGDDDVGPDAWVQVGRWVGQMHRLGMPLAAAAPRDLDYGNHPHPKLFRCYLDQTRIAMPDDHRAILQRVDRLVDKITTHTSDHLDGGSAFPISGYISISTSCLRSFGSRGIDWQKRKRISSKQKR